MDLYVVSITNIYYNAKEGIILLLSADSGMYKIEVYKETKRVYVMIANAHTLRDMYSTGLWSYIGVL